MVRIIIITIMDIIIIIVIKAFIKVIIIIISFIVSIIIVITIIIMIMTIIAILQEDHGQTGGHLVSVEDRSIRSCCQNAVAISVLMLSDELNERICQMVISAAVPVREWHGLHSKACRSSEGCHAWRLDQYLGGYLKH
eukprot:10351054-Karenia_brevis.AAC.1